MRLTRYTDYSLRVLMYLGTHEDRQCSIAEIAAAHRVSRHHLMKVVNALARGGYVDAVRGRAGGLRLGRPSREIRVGEVVRTTEEGLELADCPSCVIVPACRLKGVLGEGVTAMLKVFDTYTLADLLEPRRELRRLLTAQPRTSSARAARKAR